MSAVAPPVNTPPPSPLVTAAKAFINKNVPMNNLPPIPRNNSTAEANAQRQDYQPPKFFPGEMVFYRKKGTGTENLAWVLAEQNKSFTLAVAENNNVIREVKSVDYWDHTDPKPEATGDPMAGHHVYGTFRRTIFGKKVMAMMADLTDGIQLPEANNDQAELIRTINDKTSDALLGMMTEIEEFKKGTQEYVSKLQTQVAELTAQVQALKPKESPKK